ncbi:MAG TPA: aminotransferase class I/II-fold pyridoxal phosphate-dependent enzyme [Enhygromyxa sp.]|nr:aminotransferase class I/II-fold pyridoxal phosphate-dependent enzyme [Enhygromyxa sp.]
MVKGRLRPVDYLAWAQTVPAGARWNLTASGVPDACGPGSVASGAERERQPPGWPLLGKLEIEDLCRRDKRPEILAGFLQTVAERYDVAPECVVPTVGSSGAITQILFALARPGDHVIVERPTFEPLHRVPEMLGLSVSRLERKFEERWEPLPDRLARLLTPKTRAVILSSLHNPSGVAVDSKTLAAIGEMAARVGAAVLIDEVYLDFDFHPTGDPDGEPRPWRPAAVAIDNGVSWSSTTKCFGFAALRAGWVVTRDRDAAQAFRLAANYFHVDVPLASLALATQVMRHAVELEQLAARAIAPARAIIDRWIAAEPRVAWVPPTAGHTGLVRLPDLTADVAFARHLREAYDTQVVPGTLFEVPGSVRISFNLPTDELEQALAHVSAALDDFQAGRAVG